MLQSYTNEKSDSFIPMIEQWNIILASPEIDCFMYKNIVYGQADNIN